MTLSSLLLSLSVVAASALADPQSPIAPIRIEPPSGGGNPVVISVTGVEQDPVPVVGRWNTSDACATDIACFVGNWIEANSTGSLDHLLALRAPTERKQVEARLREPQVLARNTSRFNSVKRWGLLGWADYGAVRIVFLSRQDDDQSPLEIYTLPITRADGRWVQTDVLAGDSGIYQIFDRIGTAILERHRKRP